MAMRSKDAGRIITAHRGDAVIVATMTAIPWLRELSPSPLNVSCTPLMGGASALGLGISLARPDREVLVLDGDGSLLMQLGSLVTIAGAQPSNLFHFVFHNRVWFEGYADFPLPNAERNDFAALARAAGYAAAYRIDTADALRDQLGRILAGHAPALIELEVTTMGTDRARWTPRAPQDEVPDMIFSILGEEARTLRDALTVAER